MIIVGGNFELEPAARDAFIASRLDMMRRSRSETGCLEYVFCADPLDPARVVLFERWESQEALDAHLQALRSGPAADPEPRPRTSSIVLYDVASERSIGG